jgi:hypothetical protein
VSSIKAWVRSGVVGVALAASTVVPALAAPDAPPQQFITVETEEGTFFCAPVSAVPRLRKVYPHLILGQPGDCSPVP